MRTYLQFVQIISELLEALFKRDETGGKLGHGGTPCLHDFLLVEQSLETEAKLLE